MSVYMIQAGGPTGPVKIGYGDAQSRVTELQIGNHLELRIIRQFEGAGIEEVALHVRFADLHIRGEWHNFSRTMLGHVGLFEIHPEPPSLVPAPPPLVADITGPSAAELGIQIAALRRSKGLTQSELATEVNVSRVTIAMIETGKDFPGRDLLWRLDRLFGGAFVVPASAAQIQPGD